MNADTTQLFYSITAKLPKFPLIVLTNNSEILNSKNKDFFCFEKRNLRLGDISLIINKLYEPCR